MNLIRSMVFLASFSVPIYSFAAPDIEVGFSPEGSAQKLVLKVINGAHKSIQMIGYSFQAPDIAKALVAARQRGVDVRVVVDWTSLFPSK